MQAASSETAFRLLYLIGSQHAPDDDAAADLGMGRPLVEFDLTDDPSSPQVPLDGVHRDLLEADPSGRGGEDLWN